MPAIPQRPDVHAPHPGPRDADESLAVVRARQQAAVAALGVRALGGLALATLLDETVAVVARGARHRVREDRRAAAERRGRAGSSPASAGPRASWGTRRSACSGDSPAGYALRSHAPVVVDDLSTDTRLGDPPLLREHGVRSGVSVVLYGPGGSAYGVVGAHTARSRRFTAHDVDFLQGIANVLSAALHRQYVEDDLRRARAEAESFSALLQDQATELEQQTEEAQALAEERR